MLGNDLINGVCDQLTAIVCINNFRHSSFLAQMFHDASIMKSRRAGNKARRRLLAVGRVLLLIPGQQHQEHNHDDQGNDEER